MPIKKQHVKCDFKDVYSTECKLKNYFHTAFKLTIFLKGLMKIQNKETTVELKGALKCLIKLTEVSLR